jgi:hypothetical protein
MCALSILEIKALFFGCASPGPGRALAYPGANRTALRFNSDISSVPAGQVSGMSSAAMPPARPAMCGTSRKKALFHVQTPYPDSMKQLMYTSIFPETVGLITIQAKSRVGARATI